MHPPWTAAVSLTSKPLFERLQPAPRHPGTRVRFAAGQRLQLLVHRAGHVDTLHLEIAFGEETALLGDPYAHGAKRAGVPDHLDFARCGARRDGICACRHAADGGTAQRVEQRSV
jgi:hypothetical protein